MHEKYTIIKVPENVETSGPASRVKGKIGRITEYFSSNNYPYIVHLAGFDNDLPTSGEFAFTENEIVLLAVGDKVKTASDEGLDLSHLGEIGEVVAIVGGTITVKFSDLQLEVLEYYHLDGMAE